MTSPATPSKIESAAIWNHAHSFRVGWCLFSSTDRALVARLYAALRWMDDFVDDAPAAERTARFAQVKAWADYAVADRPTDLPPPIQALIKDGTRLTDWAEFFAGQAMDADSQPCPDSATLTLYCQRAAGVVGLMFCDLTGILEPAARAPASALGRAMQLTNISRDIVEDARRDRSYLSRHSPAAVLQAERQRRSEGASVTLSPSQQQIEAEVIAWLTQAQTWYTVGLAGLRYLPFRAALGIAVGARLYRAIGQKILRQPNLIWQGRTRTTQLEKITLTVQAIAALVASRLRQSLT